MQRSTCSVDYDEIKTAFEEYFKKVGKNKTTERVAQAIADCARKYREVKVKENNGHTHSVEQKKM